MYTYDQPIVLILTFTPILICILLVVAADKKQPDTMTMFLKFSIYLLSVIVFINLIFFARAHTFWY